MRTQGSENREGRMCLKWIQALLYVSEIKEKTYSKKKYRHFHFHSLSFPDISNLRQFLLAPLSFGPFLDHKDKIKYQGSEHRHGCVFPKPLVCVRVLSRFSCAWLFVTPIDCSPLGLSVLGILQARILEWVAMPSSRGSYWPRDWTHVSYVSSIGRRLLYH